MKLIKWLRKRSAISAISAGAHLKQSRYPSHRRAPKSDEAQKSSTSSKGHKRNRSIKSVEAVYSFTDSKPNHPEFYFPSLKS